MKMKIVYKPDAADRQEWVVDRENPAWDVAYGAEQATNWGWIEFRERLDGISPTAWRALLWVLRKRDEPRLRLEHVVIDDWNALQRHFQCLGCQEWVSFAAVAHECVIAEPDEDEDDAPESDDEVEEVGDVDPEA